MAKTAAELLAELSKNKKYQKVKKNREERVKSLEDRLKADEESLLDDLKSAGMHVQSVWDLVNTDSSYEKAIPVLLQHIEKKHHPKTLAGIARSLAVPEATGNPNTWNILYDLYLKTASDESIEIPELRGFKEGLAVAISFLFNEHQLQDVISLIKNDIHGESRVLLVEGLKRYKDLPEIVKFLKALRKDDNVLKKIAKEVLG